jgi:uncharacterized membrane protein
MNLSMTIVVSFCSVNYSLFFVCLFVLFLISLLALLFSHCFYCFILFCYIYIVYIFVGGKLLEKGEREINLYTGTHKDTTK